MNESQMIEKPKFKTDCINCGDSIIGTVGQLINNVPLCNNCRKTRKKVKRGNFI